MTYYIKADAVSIESLRERLETTDLVPSRISLLNGLKEKLNMLKKQELISLADLRVAIKTPKRIEFLVQRTGIEKDYLILLRREINSYFPKPFSLHLFDWLPQLEIEKLEKEGIKNTLVFYESSESFEEQESLRKLLQIEDDIFYQLICLCDLVRMQWTNPLAARMFFDAGYDSVQKVKTANPETFCNTLIEINADDKYFKGKIGLRDIKRLINSASYL